MAQVKGLLKAVGAEGKFGEYVTYRLHGKLVMRRIGKLEKKAYAEGPSFEQLRQNQTEFSLASQISKTIRQALGEYEKLWCDRYCSGRLTGRLRKILQQGSGKSGQRSFEPNHLSLLNEFPMNKAQPKKAFLCTAGNFLFDPDRQCASLTYHPDQLSYWLGDFEARNKQLILGIIFLSSIHFNKGYKIAEPEWHGRAFISECAGNERQVQVKLPAPGLPEEVGWIGVVGVR